ncbi:MAG: 50S ribosomal protein L19 [Clostridia bacterium]|nr:50S ribosomal protein L19 [Clostridia bacterium]
MATIIDQLEREGMKESIPEFGIGDTVKVNVKIKEGDKERIQAFEGVVIARKNGGIRETFTVRKMSYGVGVEKSFPIHSPKIASIEVVRKGKPRRAKLYYVRDLTGKAAKVKSADNN